MKDSASRLYCLERSFKSDEKHLIFFSSKRSSFLLFSFRTGRFKPIFPKPKKCVGEPWKSRLCERLATL